MIDALKNYLHNTSSQIKEISKILVKSGVASSSYHSNITVLIMPCQTMWCTCYTNTCTNIIL